MFKYLFCFVLLVGCGAPQTPDEVKADIMMRNFVASCKEFYGNECDVPMTVSLTESADGQTCWTEEGNPIRSVVLYRKDVSQNNKTSVYETLFQCSLNLGEFQDNLLNFSDFAAVSPNL